LTEFFYILIILGLAIGFCLCLIIMNRRYQKLLQENKLLKKDQEGKSNQNSPMDFEHTKFILNQHLFKNTLNSIQGYAFRTNQALERLGGVLDYVLYDSSSRLISFKEELEFAKNFIELNKIKLLPIYDIRIKENIDTTSLFYDRPVIIPLITAYFIENTFKHADLQNADAFISIEIELNDAHFLFVVSNKVNAKPMLDPKSGIGKENMKRRLEMAYKGGYKLEYVSEGGIYTSYLKIDFNEFKD
jgi:LytS/YehU family sensor histidine kinase